METRWLRMMKTKRCMMTERRSRQQKGSAGKAELWMKCISIGIRGIAIRNQAGASP